MLCSAEHEGKRHEICAHMNQMSTYHIHETRKLFKLVAKAIHERQDRVTTEQLLAECQRLKPSLFCKPFFLKHAHARFVILRAVQSGREGDFSSTSWKASAAGARTSNGSKSGQRPTVLESRPRWRTKWKRAY